MLGHGFTCCLGLHFMWNRAFYPSKILEPLHSDFLKYWNIFENQENMRFLTVRKPNALKYGVQFSL